MTPINQQIQVARKNANMTQAQLAAAVGLQQGNISLIESGDRTPTVETLERLSAALGVVFVIGE